MDELMDKQIGHKNGWQGGQMEADKDELIDEVIDI